MMTEDVFLGMKVVGGNCERWKKLRVKFGVFLSSCEEFVRCVFLDERW